MHLESRKACLMMSFCTHKALMESSAGGYAADQLACHVQVPSAGYQYLHAVCLIMQYCSDAHGAGTCLQSNDLSEPDI